MTRQRFLGLLIAALAIVVAGWYAATQRSQPDQAPGLPLLPALANDVNAVTTLRVRKGSAKPTLTVHKTGAEWTVAERADYPADVTKIRKLLLSLRETKIVEEKTSDPGRFAAIGVADPASAGADGVEVAVAAASFNLAIIVGKAAGEGTFVRRLSDNRTFSVEPAISVETEPRFWIDSRLLDIPAALLQSVEVKPAVGPGYTLHRLNPADNTFSLDGVPPGRTALDGHALAPGPSTFGNLTADDVAPTDEVEATPASHAMVTLSDGNILTFTGTVIGTHHWLRLQASKDPALTAKVQGRAFDIASYRYDALFKPLEQLLVPKEPPPVPPAKKASAAPLKTSALPTAP